MLQDEDEEEEGKEVEEEQEEEGEGKQAGGHHHHHHHHHHAEDHKHGHACAHGVVHGACGQSSCSHQAGATAAGSAAAQQGVDAAGPEGREGPEGEEHGSCRAPVGHGGTSYVRDGVDLQLQITISSREEEGAWAHARVGVYVCMHARMCPGVHMPIA